MTAQIGDVLKIGEEYFTLFSFPNLPEKHPRLVKTDEPIQVTALWREYIGEWELREGRLYLNKVTGLYRVDGEPILAEWFSGVLMAPIGELLHYVHMGFWSIYEKEMRIYIENGKETRRETIRNRNYK